MIQMGRENRQTIPGGGVGILIKETIAKYNVENN